jgi:hypothetical protein
MGSWAQRAVQPPRPIIDIDSWSRRAQAVSDGERPSVPLSCRRRLVPLVGGGGESMVGRTGQAPQALLAALRITSPSRSSLSSIHAAAGAPDVGSSHCLTSPHRGERGRSHQLLAPRRHARACPPRLEGVADRRARAQPPPSRRVRRNTVLARSVSVVAGGSICGGCSPEPPAARRSGLRLLVWNHKVSPVWIWDASVAPVSPG